MSAAAVALLISLLTGGPGVAAFRDGEFATAYMHFHAMAALEPTGQNLANLGNAAFRLGRFAEALQHYLRAELRLGIDSKLAFNRRWTEDKLGYRRSETVSVLSVLKRTWSSVPASYRMASLALIHALLAFSLVLTTSTWPRRVVGILLLATTLFLAFRVDREISESPRLRAVVLTTEVVIRSEPQLGRPEQFRLRSGDVVEVLAHSERFLELKHERGRGFAERRDFGLVD